MVFSVYGINLARQSKNNSSLKHMVLRNYLRIYGQNGKILSTWNFEIIKFSLRGNVVVFI